MKEDEVKDMIREVDTDAKGAIDFPEFLSFFMRKMPEIEPEEEYALMFMAIDEKRKGEITFENLKKYMIKIGEYNPKYNKGDSYV